MTDRSRPVVAGSVGIFGGTFDPVHVAHLAVAEEAADALGLERILFVPAGEPPHKPGVEITSGSHRLAMLELAVADNPRFAVSRIELDRAGPSYTVDTLTAIVARRAADGVAADGLHLVLSAEAFMGLPTWRDPRRVLDLARFVVSPRDGYPDAGREAIAAWFPDRPDLAGRAVFLDSPRLHLSASVLRERAASGRSLRYLVPDAVCAYIGDHALYPAHRRIP